MGAAKLLATETLRLTAAAETILDARTDPRVGVNFPVKIFSSDFSGFLSGFARDISVGGVCVATPSPFALGSVQRIRLDLPSGSVDLEAHGRWQIRPTGEVSVLSGAGFVGPSHEQVSLLWDAVHTACKDLSFFIFDRSELQDMSADDADELASASRYRLLSARQTVYQAQQCRPGDDSIFIVKQGEVSLRARLAPSREVTLARLKPGGVFGGLPVVADMPNQESAYADTEATLLEISRGSISYLRVAKPLLAQRLAQVITRLNFQRLQRLIELSAIKV